MALFAGITRSLTSLRGSTNSPLYRIGGSISHTCQPNSDAKFSSSDSKSEKKQDGQASQQQQEPATEGSKPSGWLDKVFSSSSSRIHTGNRPHSRLLSASEFIYEMHYHDAIPEKAHEYIGKYETYSKELSSRTNNKAELVGSFRVEIGGNQDQFVHIWRYHDGYKQASEIHKQIRSEQTLVNLNKDIARDIVKRETQFMMSFSFWDHPKPQDHNSFYEIRSYVLKPGTMIEWANGWSKGIKHRDNAVAGFFSQIGQLYNVHHIWRYQDLQQRKDVRETAWQRPGWDECVAITVPNIVYLHSRWMSPNKFSPIR